MRDTAAQLDDLRARLRAREETIQKLRAEIERLSCILSESQEKIR